MWRNLKGAGYWNSFSFSQKIIAVSAAGVSVLVLNRIFTGHWFPQFLQNASHKPQQLLSSTTNIVSSVRKKLANRKAQPIGHVICLNLYPLLGGQPITVDVANLNSFSINDGDVYDKQLIVVDNDDTPITEGLESVQVQVLRGSLTLRVPGREPLLINVPKIIQVANLRIHVLLENKRLLTGFDCGFGAAAWICKVLSKPNRSCRVVCFDSKSQLHETSDRPFQATLTMLSNFLNARNPANIEVKLLPEFMKQNFENCTVSNAKFPFKSIDNKNCLYTLNYNSLGPIAVGDVVYG